MNKLLMFFALSALFLSSFTLGREPIDPKRYELLSGVRNSKDLKKTDSGFSESLLRNF